MSPQLLRKKPVRRLIGSISDRICKVVEPAISKNMPQAMADKLREDVFIFSGFKTYHQLKEASELLRDKKGAFKSFDQFYEDTKGIRDKYNKNWLKAEYNYARRSSEMAARWAEIEKDKEEIDLVYQTVGDGRVRPAHQDLNEICLPASHPFWNRAFPPNGWNCRCTVREEEKGERAYTKIEGLEDKFNESTPQHFRFNPGKEQTIFPKKHPYYGKNGYGHCQTGKLASDLNKNEECEILKNVLHEEQERKEVRELEKRLRKEGSRTIKTKRFGEVLISKIGFKETRNKNTGDYKKQKEALNKVRDLEDMLNRYKGKIKVDPPNTEEKRIKRPTLIGYTTIVVDGFEICLEKDKVTKGMYKFYFIRKKE